MLQIIRDNGPIYAGIIDLKMWVIATMPHCYFMMITIFFCIVIIINIISSLYDEHNTKDTFLKVMNSVFMSMKISAIMVTVSKDKCHGDAAF